MAVSYKKLWKILIDKDVKKDLYSAVRIDTNTAEAFRHGVWYAKGDVNQRLTIVPLTLAQFQKCFVSMFETNAAKLEYVRDLLLKSEKRRDDLEASEWKRHIEQVVENLVVA